MNKRLIIIFVFTLFLNGYFALAQNTVVSGINKDYKNDTIVFYSYSDLITDKRQKLFSVIVNNKGEFSKEIKLNETTYAYCFLGVYKASLYLKPGKNYKIKFPPKKEKTKKEKLNPYFTPKNTYIQVITDNKNELNFLIQNFDYYYSHYIEDNFYNIYVRGRHSDVDTFIQKLDTLFYKYNNPFFKKYKKYKVAKLRYLAYERDKNYVINHYFLDYPILYNNIAYMSFFKQLFKDYLAYYSQQKEGKEMYDAVAKAKSVRAIKKSLNKSIVLENDSLQELIILKGLHDALLLKETSVMPFPRKQIFQTLDSMRLLTKNNIHKRIAENIKEKFSNSKIEQYNTVIDFELYNKDSNLVSLSNYENKYIYLSFYSFWSYTCMREIELLKNLKDKFGDKLEIITVFCDGSHKKLKEFMQENDYEWPIVLYKNQESIIKDYRIEAYPTYYLIGPDKKFVFSPAPGPSENFDRKFIQILQKQN